MKRHFALPLVLLLFAFVGMKPAEKEFYEIRIYHVKSDTQEARVEAFLENALIPGLHTAGVKHVGVFKPIEKDTADLKVYVLIPYASLNEVTKIESALAKDKTYQQKGAEYLDTKYDNPAFRRIEKIFLQAFSHQPTMQLPQLKNARSERVYELRSYEGHSEKIFQNKVHMFNEGGEVELFKRLGFNAVFYGEVIAGSHMPNLMYMTTFDNKQSREDHWDAFKNAPEWKKLIAMPEYQNNVSHIDIMFLRPTAYSDF